MNDDYVDVCGMYLALRGQLIERFHNGQSVALQIDSLKAKAVGYAWGREDAGETPIREVYGRRVSGASWEFGYMYGIVCLMYQLEMIYMKPSIRNAWHAFRDSRDLTEYIHV